MTRERPIIFSGPMVQAILAGRKTQTRRIVKPSAYQLKYRRERGYQFTEEQSNNAAGSAASALLSMFGRGADYDHPCPYGKPGDRLWVRETWRPGVSHSCTDTCDCGDVFVTYAADGKHAYFTEYAGVIPDTWYLPQAAKRGNVSPLHMPRWASRILLEITEVRVERLQNINGEDAIAEGLSRLSKDAGRTWKFGIPDRDGLPGNDDDGWHWQDWSVDPREAFARIWRLIHGEGSWQLNPWVWVIEFKRLESHQAAA